MCAKTHPTTSILISYDKLLGKFVDKYNLPICLYDNSADDYLWVAQNDKLSKEYDNYFNHVKNNIKEIVESESSLFSSGKHSILRYKTSDNRFLIISAPFYADNQIQIDTPIGIIEKMPSLEAISMEQQDIDYISEKFSFFAELLEENIRLREELYIKSTPKTDWEQYENLPFPIIEIDATGRFLNANPVFAQDTQLPIKNILGKNISDILSLEGKKSFELAMPSIASLEARVIDLEIQLNTKIVYFRCGLLSHKNNSYTLGLMDISSQLKKDIAQINTKNRMEVILNSIGDGVIATDTKGKITGMNSVAEYMTGYKEEEAIGMELEQVFKIFSAISKKPVDNPVRKVLENGQIVGLANHTELIAKDGRVFQIADSAAPIKFENDIYGVVLVFSDVTENYAMLKSLEESEVFYRTLFDSANDAIIISDESGKIVDVNVKSVSMFTKSKSEFLQLRLTDLFDIDLEKLHLDGYDGTVVKVEKEYHSTLTHQLSLELSISAFNVKGAKKYLAVIKDISDKKEDEQMIIRQKEMMELIIDSIPQYIFWKNNNSVYTGCNANFAELAGLKDVNDIIGRTDYELPWQMDEVVSFRDYDKQVLEQKKVISSIINRLTKADGSQIITETTKIPLTNEDGKVIGILGMLSDITEKHRYEATIKESQEKFKTIFEQSPYGICHFDTTGTITDLNGSLIAMLNLSKDEILGYNIIDDLKNNQYVSKQAKAALDNGISFFNGEFKIVTEHQNRQIWVKAIFKRLGCKDDAAGGIAIIEDFTDKYIAETKLRKTEALLSSAIEYMASGVVITDSKGEFIRVNRGACEILGDTEDNLLGKSPSNPSKNWWIYTLEDKPFNLEEFPLTRAIRNGEKTRNLELYVKRRDGVKRWILLNASPVWDSTGAIISAVVIFQDITARKHAEGQILKLNEKLEDMVESRTEQLKDALEELRYEVDERKRAEIELYKTQEELRISYEAEKELNELKTRFISMVSHEYRTPLTVILSSTYILDQFYQMQDYRGFSKQIDHIQSAVKSMTEMLEDVLVIGRQESGRVEIFSEKYDIVDLCLEIKDQMEALFKGEHDIVIDSSSPKVYVRTDSKILLHILNNLASNACKYSPKAESVRIKIRESEEEISVAIIDKGIGIPEKEQKSVFEPFFRSHNIGTIPGTGLGLAIVKRFVDMLDARLTLQSKEHEGSTFTLFLKKN